ncbi:MAG: GTP cyclohydrolase I FolE [Planctomycetota bacterium]|jgi:GTP cyclohydrolase I
MSTDSPLPPARADGPARPAAGIHIVDTPRIEHAVSEILAAVGEDVARDGLLGTPARVARMYTEILSGNEVDPARHMLVTFKEDHHEMVVVKDIPFESLCEHHLMPFHGRAHVAYVPNGQIVGLSKVARVVEEYARRLQVQERLTSQVADLIMKALSPQGVGVVMEATHTCMTMRGIRKPGAQMVTSAVRGTFKSCAETRAEFMTILGR